ncbi:MAG: aminopeptidase, partial [Clostridiales bacterium]|nr:aminopeptidase [Clostridiales bacterium]
YPSLVAVCDYEGVPARTLCCVLTDKEEIGSVGATGMEAKYFENTVAELYACTGAYSELGVRRALANSLMLSSDVSAGFDPSFSGVYDKKNSAYLGGGLSFNKYTGVRGKSGSNDANAEFIAQVRRLMDEAGVTFQMAELGRVDAGGGGTIAYVCALQGMNVIDSGIPVLSMHAPWEAVSKVDLYEAYKGYTAFLRGAGLNS